MTVIERLKAARQVEREIRQTPCARCGHAFVEHDSKGRGRCWYPRVLASAGSGSVCICRQFVDPASVLNA